MKFKLKSQGGTAVVEFAVILPLLVLLVFGIIEFSILLYDKAMVTNASREGARAGIVFNVDNNGNFTPVSDATIRNTVNTYLSTYLISLGNPVARATIPAPTRIVNPSTGNLSPGGELTVVVQYNYTFMVIPNAIRYLIPTMIIPNPIRLTATTVMRFE